MHVVDAATGAMMTAAAAAANPAAAQVVRDAGFHPHVTKRMVATGCLEMVAKSMPKKVLARVKRHMRHNVRKPSDMTIRDFYQHIQRMNELEVSALPPCGLLQKFNTDELIETSFSVSRSLGSEKWIVKDLTPISPMLQDTRMLLCEQIEAAEEHDDKQTLTVNKKKGNSSSKNAKSKGDDGKGKVLLQETRLELHAQYFRMPCPPRRETPEVRQLFQQALPTRRLTVTRRGTAGSRSLQLISRRRKLAAFIKKQVTAGVRKELNSVSKKLNNSSDDELDLNALEKDLDNFNSDMDNLQIESDDDDEVEA